MPHTSLASGVGLGWVGLLFPQNAIHLPDLVVMRWILVAVQSSLCRDTICRIIISWYYIAVFE